MVAEPEGTAMVVRSTLLPWPGIQLLLISGCAEPLLPTGGPVDRTPPAISASVPSNGAVNYEEDFVRLEFSEYVDQASFARAFSVTPALSERLRFAWRQRRVDVAFPEPLRDSTTYVLIIGTDLRDVRGIKITSPLTLAFATGPVIDKGRITGSVVEPFRGRGMADIDVLAYQPGALEPAYRTQTDGQGRFVLPYVREGEYSVIALLDRNRNQRPDPSEIFAVPPTQIIHTTEDTTLSLRRWIITRLDTIPPTLDRVRQRDAGIVEARFSEAVVLPGLDPTMWSLADSVTGYRVPILRVFQAADDPVRVFLEARPATPGTYFVEPDSAIADSSANRVRGSVVTVDMEPVENEAPRFEFFRFLPEEQSGEVILLPHQYPELVFSMPPDRAALDTLVTARDSTGAVRSIRIGTRNGTTYTLQLVPPLSQGEIVRVTVSDTLHQVYRRMEDRDLGSLSGTVQRLDIAHPVVIEVYAADEPGLSLATTYADSMGWFEIAGLQEDNYDVRAFIDLNQNSQWDGGQLQPFQPTEPITWTLEAIAVRARWNSALADTLVFHVR